MRFSVKKAARDVREHLITARNEAIVVRGMGLGSVAASASAYILLVRRPIQHSSITNPEPHKIPER